MTESKHAAIDEILRGTVFDIKRFATGDGPGIRSLVFLKGCPLRCVWCANPESHRSEPEIMYHRLLCVGCARCVEVCPTNAIQPDETYGFVTDPDTCIACGRCIDVCVYGAREMVGQSMTVAEVMRVIQRDRRYYDNSGGGVTISGGEPLFQYQFTRELLRACKDMGIHTAIETSGYADWEAVASVLPFLDLIFFDLKQTDSARHQEHTGVSNQLILENLKRIASDLRDAKLVVRIPFVPGYNGDEDTLKEMFSWLAEVKGVVRVELMPYHRLGMAKYDGLGRSYQLRGIEQVQHRELARFVDLGKRYGLDVRIDSR